MRFLQAKRLKAEGENKALSGPSSNKAASQGGASGEGRTVGPSASPQARQLAGELGVELADLKGTGSGGAITAGDVRKAHEERGKVE